MLPLRTMRISASPYFVFAKPLRCRAMRFGAILCPLTSPPEPDCMPDVFVAKAKQLPDGERRIVSHAGREIGVFHWQGQFYAYENLCVHQGGPACGGNMNAKGGTVRRAAPTPRGTKT